MTDAFIKFKLLRPGARLPQRGTAGSGGFDFFAPEDGHLEIGEKRLIPTGIAHDMPGELMLYPGARRDDLHGIVKEGFAIPFKMQGILFDRSGLGGKKGICLSFKCLIDNDYRGEIYLSIENRSGKPFDWKAGDRLTQIAYVLMYAGGAEETQTLTDTHRGEGGFGSTGR
jgi:dUTP pyrophosphatase